MVPEAELEAVDVERARKLLDDGEDEVADLVVGEVERGAQLVVGAGRGLLDLEVGVVDEEAGSGPDALLDGDVAVVVVDADAREELHAAPVALVEEDLEGLDAGVEQRQEAPVLQAGVVVETVAAPVGRPALGVCLLDEGVHAGVGELVHPAPEVFLARGVGQVAHGDAGGVADVYEAPISSRGMAGSCCGAGHIGLSSAVREAS